MLRFRLELGLGLESGLGGLVGMFRVRMRGWQNPTGHMKSPSQDVCVVGGMWELTDEKTDADENVK